MPTAPASKTLARASVAIVVTIVAVVLFWSRIRGIGLMGFDSYPIILTARIESLGDLLGTFTEELMDGRYRGDYYRPLLNLSFALDHAIWGLEPAGYQLTNSLLFGAAALSLFFFARRLIGPAARFGPLLALALLLLHESQFEVLPVPPRRPELLCALFAFLSLGSQIGPRQLSRRWPWIPALWMACAVLTKEAALVMPAFSFVAVLLCSQQDGIRARTRHALRAIAAHAVMIVVMVAVRFAVLGGIGGPGAGTASASHSYTTLFGRVFAPESWGSHRWVIGVVAVLLATLVLLLVRARLKTRRPEAEVCPLRAAAFAVVWIVSLSIVYGITGRIERWYLFLPMTGLCLLAGAALELLLWAVRLGTGSSRRAGFLGLALLSVFIFYQIRYSPLIHRYPEWQRATVASEEFFSELRSRVERAAEGTTIAAPPLPLWVQPVGDGAVIRGGAVLDGYSVQAWSELVFPERRVRVVKGAVVQPPDANEVVVRIKRARIGFSPNTPPSSQGRGSSRRGE
jgi:hypothetical protein